MKPNAFSRRRFLQFAAVAGGALAISAVSRVARAEETPPALRARAIALLESTLSVDIHSHAGGILSRGLKTFNVGAQMKQGRVSAICLSLVSDSPVLGHTTTKIYAGRQPKPGELHAHMLERMDLADRLIKQYDMARILTLADLTASKTKGIPGVILATEGSDFLDEKLENLETAYRRGVRHWQLVHYRAGAGVGDIQTEDPVHNGATPFGLDVVRACNRLGMVVDVAHATLPTVKQIVKVATAPLVLSHTSYSRILRPQSRLIDSEHAKLIADTGGVIGIWGNGFTFSGYAGYAEGMAKLAEVVGVDHVAIGTDVDGLLKAMFNSYNDFPDLVAHLFAHFNDDEVKKIVGGNYLRVFDKITRASTETK